MKEEDIKLVKLPDVSEAEVKFKLISDRDIVNVNSDEVDEPLIEISGYDLKIQFNMKYLKSLEDIEAACQGIAKLFRDVIMEQLLSNKQQ